MDICALTGALAIEQHLLVCGPLLPERREGVAVALDAATHPQVVRRLHPGQHRLQGSEPGGAAAHALEHQQRHRLHDHGLGELAGHPVVAAVAARPPFRERSQQPLELLVDVGEAGPAGEHVVHVQEA